MNKLILWNRAKCVRCKTIWDLPILRTRKDYIPGICPKCKGQLKTIKTQLDNIYITHKNKEYKFIGSNKNYKTFSFLNKEVK